MTLPMSRQRAISEVLFATSLWGFGFIATVWAQRSFSTPELLFLRFLIAFVFGKLIYLLLFKKETTTDSWSRDLKLALPSGFFLAATLILQTVGLQYTTATKSGFLTSLYVILIPLLNHSLFKIKTKYTFYLLALTACLGAWLLMDVRQNDLNPGDIWTLACALTASFHIIYVGRVTKRIENSFRFNNFQSLWCCLLTLPLLLAQNKINLLEGSFLSWSGVVAIALGSSLIAFLIQVRTQKVLPVTTASMLFLLESPFAFFYAFLFLNEKLLPTQIVGAGLILAASYLTIHWEKIEDSRKMQPQ